MSGSRAETTSPPIVNLIRRGEYLHEFLHGAESAGQGDERIGLLRHEPFPSMHIADHGGLSIRGTFRRRLILQQRLWNNAMDVSSQLYQPACNRAHDPERTAAIDCDLSDPVR